MKLTNKEKLILSHVVLDPDAWLSHAINAFGEEKAKECLAQKIARWQPEYESERGKPKYKNRVEREDAEKEDRKPRPEQLEKMETESLIQAKIREQAISALKAEGKLTAAGELVKPK